MTDPHITRASTVLIPVVWALRCRCGAEVQGEHVLRRRPTPDDLRVAERLGRDAVGIELNEDYGHLHDERLNGVQREMAL